MHLESRSWQALLRSHWALIPGILARLSIASAAGVEQMLVTKAGFAQSATAHQVEGGELPVEGFMPSLSGA